MQPKKLLVFLLVGIVLIALLFLATGIYQKYSSRNMSPSKVTLQENQELQNIQIESPDTDMKDIENDTQEL